MIQGFNHNVRYGGRLFHVQTEDSGLANPRVITHLYHGGTIVASKKTAYADILTSDRRDEVIREIMREQHRQMLLDLRDGRLDAALAALRLAPGPGAPARPATGRDPGPAAGARGGGRAQRHAGAPKPAGAERGPADDDTRPLDDILLDYLASRAGPAEPKKKR